MKSMIIKITALVITIILLSSCSENYSNGERIGVITRFSKKGMWFKSYEGYLNITQTGMNSSGEPFEFSVDNDNEDPNLVKSLDSAARYGWKIKLNYHQVKGFNWFANRGDTDFFVSTIDIIDREFSNNNTFNSINKPSEVVTGRIVDTIYVIIDKSKGE